jgi:Domain of Unknown Function (DUF1080)
MKLMTRKFKVLTLCAIFLFLAFNSAALMAKPKWQVLFAGKSTDAWRGFRRDSFPSNCWTIDNESLKTIAGCDEADRMDLVTKDKYQDFELKLEWRVAPGGNGGVIYLVSEDEDQTWKTGPEMQVLDDAKHPDGKDPKTSAGALYGLIAPVNKVLDSVGRWNRVRLIVKKGHVEHWLNGRKVLNYDLRGEQLKYLIAESKFKEFPRFAQNREGRIALQHHGEEAWYRKIKIRSL